MDDLDNEDQWIADNLNSTFCIRWYDKSSDHRKSYYPNSRFTTYYKRNLRHRTNGPAYVQLYTTSFSPALEEWWINGEKVPCSSQEDFEKLMKLKAFW